MSRFPMIAHVQWCIVHFLDERLDKFVPEMRLPMRGEPKLPACSPNKSARPTITVGTE